MLFCAIGFHAGIVTNDRIPAMGEAVLRAVDDRSSASSGAVGHTLGLRNFSLRLLHEMNFGKLLHIAIICILFEIFERASNQVNEMISSVECKDPTTN